MDDVVGVVVIWVCHVHNASL